MKRPNVASTSREQVHFYDSRFLGAEKERRFRELASRRIWTEEGFSINLKGNSRLMAQQLELSKWVTLINPHKNWNHDVVQEFYANALPLQSESFSFKSMVRGKIINFNKDTISEYLGNPLIVREGGSYPYGKCL